MRTFLITLLTAFICGGNLFAQQTTKEVNLSGNAYVTEYREGASIRETGLTNWTDSRSKINTYVYFSQPQTIQVNVRGNAPGKSTFTMIFNNKKKTIKPKQGAFDISAGKFRVPAAGYYAFTFQGVKKEENRFADVSSLVIQSADTAMVYVHDYPDYWSRRGPSVHLGYTMPQDTVEWFYNEIIVPHGEDVIGSYFMANGFGEGYFGIQVNSESERRVLFSVWSPYDTQDPKLIPDSLKIRLLRRGKDVTIGEFGNEGSGGQSFLRYNWKAGNTYKFLTQIHPDGKGNTIYTSYFYAVDENRWRLIASFLRPKTNVYYKGAHSFLENFIPEQGYISRKVLFGNQWFLTKNGKWVEGVDARFTHDATAKAGVRLDFKGGYNSETNRFFLQNCGFFHDSTPFGTRFSHERESSPPVIDFKELEKL